MMTATAPQLHQPRQIAELFAALTDELQELGVLALNVQTVLGDALAHRSEDLSIHRAAQSLDLITQRIEGLGDFLADLLTDVPEAWHLDCGPAAERIKLDKLARRLMGKRADPLPAEDGAIEYF